VDAVLINGDVAYDLDTNNGSNYEEFLNLLEHVSARTPIIHVPGNHERRTPDAALLFNSSFKVYGLDKKLATGLSIGSLFVLPFDPYNVIYGYSEPLSSLEALRSELKRGV
jgi:3',5'-cyclic AMP phosphodiesterase CpdA